MSSVHLHLCVGVMCKRCSLECRDVCDDYVYGTRHKLTPQARGTEHGGTTLGYNIGALKGQVKAVVLKGLRYIRVIWL